MNGRLSPKSIDPAERAEPRQKRIFIFTDKRSGARRFEVKSEPDGGLPVDEAASLLAVNCMMRDQVPGDYRVFVSAGDNLPNGLKERAQKLIDACTSMESAIHLTDRQQEALAGVQQGLSNKEIAAKLHLSERTVKFHVSALFSKFGVDGRIALIHKANDLLWGAETPAVAERPLSGGPKELGLEPCLPISKAKLIRLQTLERRSRS
jgi:DNA-binding NarL/FixJ family response regulator